MGAEPVTVATAREAAERVCRERGRSDAIDKIDWDRFSKAIEMNAIVGRVAQMKVVSEFVREAMK